MDCKLLEQKILCNENLAGMEYAHIKMCVNCKKVYDFNKILSKEIKQNLRYPEITFSIPDVIYKQSRKERYATLLKPAFSYAYILVAGLLLGYMLGNFIYYIPSTDSSDLQFKSHIPEIKKINPPIHIATNSVAKNNDGEEIFAIPLDEGLKKQLNLYAGVVIRKVDEIKKIIERCKNISNNLAVDLDLESNDIIIEANGTVIENQKTLEEKLSGNCDNITLKIMRNGNVMEKRIILKIKK